MYALELENKLEQTEVRSAKDDPYCTVQVRQMGHGIHSSSAINSIILTKLINKEAHKSCFDPNNDK